MFAATDVDLAGRFVLIVDKMSFWRCMLPKTLSVHVVKKWNASTPAMNRSTALLRFAAWSSEFLMLTKYLNQFSLRPSRFSMRL